LAENGIRLRYAGFVIFLSRLISIGTGLIFTLLITRSVSPEDYGVYGNLGDILSCFTIISTIIPFWIVRFEARRWPGSLKTGFIMNFLIGLASTILYLLSVMGIISALRINLDYMPAYLIAAVMIFESHLLSALEASLYPRRPEKIGFGLLVFEVSKVVLGILSLYVFRMGLMGALLSVIFAYLCQAAFYAKLLLQGFKEKIRWGYVKEWLKASILNIYGIAGERLLILANIFLFIHGGELARAYYGASSAIASIVAYSSSIAHALYPKLLSEVRSEDITLSLNLVLMFAMPMFFGAVVLSRELLSILNPVYIIAAPTLTILALSSLVLSTSSVFESVIIGTENFDVTAKIPFKSAFGSRLFLLLTLRYLQALIVLMPTYLMLSLFQLDGISSTFYFALISCVGQIVMMVAKFFVARSSISFAIPWKNLVKYTCSSLVMALGLYALSMPPRLAMTLLRVIIGAIIYFAMLIVIDDEVRMIARIVGKGAIRYLS